jgi:hypothetical protein
MTNREPSSLRLRKLRSDLELIQEKLPLLSDEVAATVEPAVQQITKTLDEVVEVEALVEQHAETLRIHVLRPVAERLSAVGEELSSTSRSGKWSVWIGWGGAVASFSALLFALASTTTTNRLLSERFRRDSKLIPSEDVHVVALVKGAAQPTLAAQWYEPDGAQLRAAPPGVVVVHPSGLGSKTREAQRARPSYGSHATVLCKASERSLTLVLSSKAPTRWTVVCEEGSQVSGILVGGFFDQWVNVVGEEPLPRPVFHTESVVGREYFECTSDDPTDPGYLELARTLQELRGSQRIDSFQLGLVAGEVHVPPRTDQVGKRHMRVTLFEEEEFEGRHVELALEPGTPYVLAADGTAPLRVNGLAVSLDIENVRSLIVHEAEQGSLLLLHNDVWGRKGEFYMTLEALEGLSDFSVPSLSTAAANRMAPTNARKSTGDRAGEATADPVRWWIGGLGFGRDSYFRWARQPSEEDLDPMEVERQRAYDRTEICLVKAR